ncbi:RagB/SusD family nutrient uptake outer membrane protein [Danxiaibacter flavus]|uniref:RagB/SusD family nutrient uptake outer membrane protein n=1 Tax=Danxiaibacter flavus TaxID=3049108 RepID=A0ABV3ZKH2_9BACT|nr:RagB/SusD family nutrient uptake outer membrane protein [Chitinophagaceae bacterium DXS]
MKKYSSLLILIAGIFITSCKKYLDFPPEGKVPATNFFQTPDDAAKAMTSMYGNLRTWDMYGGFNYLLVNELPSDDIIKGSEPGDGGANNMYHSFQFQKTEGTFNSYWNTRYQQINLSNQVLSNVPGINMDQTLKNRYFAEAKFLRAFSYFDLLRAFGGVPIVDKVPVGPEGMLRKTSDETYDFIEKDLKDAIAVLPSDLPPAELGRATKWAAEFLLAKVYLYRQKYNECKTLTDEIISSNKFSLYGDFYKLFRPEQEFCSESIFEVVSTYLNENSGISSCQYAQIRGVRGSGTESWGWGWGTPSDNLVKAFDNAGDVVRKKVTILTRGDITPDGDLVAGIQVMDGASEPRYNGKAYVPTRIAQGKSGGTQNSDQNIRLMRYAEVLLMNAEAAVRTGGNGAASLNLVRRRAGLSDITSPTLLQILEERHLELAGEGDRFWDLVRTGRAAEVLGPQGFVAGKNELFPIPDLQVQLSGGQLTQNPGW